MQIDDELMYIYKYMVSILHIYIGHKIIRPHHVETWDHLFVKTAKMFTINDIQQWCMECNNSVAKYICQHK